MDATGIVVKPGDQALVQEHRQFVREQLGEAAFQAALQEGRDLPLDQAIETALAAGPCPETTPPTKGSALLTKREQQIKALIARGGRTNRQVAADLALSERTVDTHVSRILHKLGLSSRTQLALHGKQR